MKNTKTKLTLLVISICLLIGISFFVYKSYLSDKPSECDEIIDIPQSNPPEDFETMLAGVKYAVVINSIEDINNENFHIAFEAFVEFLYEMGFEGVVEGNNYNPKKLGERLYVNLSLSCNYYNYYNIGMNFAGFQFSTDKIANRVYNSNSTTKENLKQAFRDMYKGKKAAFDTAYTIQFAKKQTCWTEEKLKSIMQKQGCDEIEGIYESSKRKISSPKYRVAVRNIKGIYYLIYLSGADNTGDWNEGEIKATLESTAIPMLYKAYWLMANKYENDNYYIEFEKNGFNLNSNDRDTTFYIKMFPPASNKKR